MNPKFFVVLNVGPNAPFWLYHHAFACAGGTVFGQPPQTEQSEGNGDGAPVTAPPEGGRTASPAWSI